MPDTDRSTKCPPGGAEKAAPHSELRAGHHTAQHLHPSSQTTYRDNSVDGIFCCKILLPNLVRDEKEEYEVTGDPWGSLPESALPTNAHGSELGGEGKLAQLNFYDEQCYRCLVKKE